MEIDANSSGSYPTVHHSVDALDSGPSSDALTTLATMQSSPGEMAVQSNRKRAPAWTDREVLDLIAVWGDESVLSELRSKRRNAKIYEKISKAMAERGYSRDATQCRVKIKELRQGYQKTKEANGCSGSQPHTSRFYQALHSILGAAHTGIFPWDSREGVGQGQSSCLPDCWQQRLGLLSM
uniref:Myb/SANT-like DNA-binding domain-containing protein n=1 Tax=Terrapene triunguis TaxID=2587831 RepID=A0A674I0F3_9SAUR